MNLLVFLVCTCVIVYVTKPCAWATETKIGDTASPRHPNILKHKYWSSASKQYDTNNVKVSIHKQVHTDAIPPPKFHQLNKIHSASEVIQGSTHKTNERGINGPSSVGSDGVSDVQDDDDDEELSDAVDHDLDHSDVQSHVEDDKGLKLQDIISELNGLDSLENIPDHLKLVPKTSGILNNILNFIDQFRQFYTPVNSNNSECAKDIGAFGGTEDIHNGTLWAILMADAWGKLPDGFLFGNVHIPGMFEECQNIHDQYVFQPILNPGHPLQKPQYGDEEPRNITGRYCQVHYRFVKPDTRSGTLFAILKAPIPWNYGTCIPNSCTEKDMQESLNQTFNAEGNEGLELVRIFCHEESSYKDMRDVDVIMLSTLLTLVAIMFICTVVDLISAQFNMDYFRSGMVFKVIETFSFLANMKKIFTYDPPVSGTITCLPGIRVITMMWIVVCHQYGTALDFTSNTFDQLKYQDPVITQVVSNGFVAVDTFLYVGGLVITYNMLPRLLKGQVVNPFAVLFRMLWRMLPSIIFLASFCFTLLRFLAFGPRAYIVDDFVEKCSGHWWKDALFINNFLFPDNEGHAVNDCLDHCWYTAVHMQLAFATVFLILTFATPFSKRKILGYATTVFCSLVAILVPLSITIGYDLPPSPLWTISLDKSFEYMWRVYLVPWCRAGPWVVGVWTALALRSKRLSNISIPRIVVLLGYIAAIALGLTIVVGLYPYNHLLPDKKWTPTLAAFYGSLARPGWALCVAWVVFTCQTNNADMVNATLSWPGWRPLGRLTFTMYLVAPVVQLWWATTQYVPVYYNYLAKLFESVGVLFVSGMAALFLSVLVELPCMRLAGLIVPSMLKSTSKFEEEKQQGLTKVHEHELKDLELYPSLEEISTNEILKVELFEDEPGRKWNMSS